jgi:hypothetical protein
MGSAKRGKAGRPPLPPDVARSERVVAFLRRADLQTLERVAKARGIPVGQAARELLEHALRRRK